MKHTRRENFRTDEQLAALVDGIEEKVEFTLPPPTIPPTQWATGFIETPEDLDTNVLGDGMSDAQHE